MIDVSGTGADYPLDRARKRFSSALDGLEAAVRRRLEREKSNAALEAELRTLSEDRSRLAQELDKSQARAVKLATISGDVSARLDSAIGVIRGLVDTKSTGIDR